MTRIRYLHVLHLFPQWLHCSQDFLPIRFFSCQECHDGGEAGAGKHLLDLLVMRGDLGVFIMASWSQRFFEFFFRWKQMETLEKSPIHQEKSNSHLELIYIPSH